MVTTEVPDFPHLFQRQPESGKYLGLKSDDNNHCARAARPEQLLLFPLIFKSRVNTARFSMWLHACSVMKSMP